MAPHDLLQQLHELDKTSPRFHEQLCDFLRGDAYRDGLQNLPSEDSVSLIEYLNCVLVDISDCATPVFQESLRELRKICGVKQVIPKLWNLSESLLGCVYKGTFNGSKVRIRRVRMYSGGDPSKLKEAFYKVAVMSKCSTHPNIVPLLGVTMEPLELISDWMPGGDLPRHIAKHSDANILSLLSDVAEGLNYLHSCDMIHGDLKGSNILVDATDRARITDFGLAAVTQGRGSIRNASVVDDQGARWIAPEIFGNGSYSKEADIFSYAGVAIEAFTGAVPFNEKSFLEAKSAVERGERPPRPIHPTLTDEMWALTQQCWSQEALLRPHALRVSCGFRGIPPWKPLIDRSLTSEERGSLITDIFSNNHDTQVVKCLHGNDAQSFVDVIDEVLDTLAPWLRRTCLDVLRTICGQQALLPISVQITPSYNRFDDPQYRGGCADVWKGDYEGRKVAVKVLRIYGSSCLDSVISKFCKEVIMWKSLDNPNVLPLLGATMSEKRFTMISEWMDNRNINEFVKAHGESVNWFELLKDVTSGLIYLHAQEVIHGDLKEANILIDQNQRACLADFGLLTFAADPTNPTSSTSTASICGTIRWMSPELLEDNRPTKESDRYALGMVILEVLSGQVPFVGDSDFAVVRKVIDGDRPKRPEQVWFTDDMWGILESCWAPQPRERPSLEVVLQFLEQKSRSWTAFSHPVPLAPNSSSRELPDQDRTPNTDGFIIHDSNSGPEDTQMPAHVDKTSTQFLDQRPNDLPQGDSDVEKLDKSLDNLSPTSFTFKWTHQKLRGACAFQSLLPSSHLLFNPALNIDEHPFASSGVSDAYSGTYDDLRVCIKRLRVASDTNSGEAKKVLFREALMWKRLTHPNIVPFIGVTIDPPQIASWWMPNGNLTTYITSNPDQDRVPLLVDIAKGLDYIHSHGVIHGDLKGPNILVDVSGNARITDFALAQGILGVVSMPERWSMRWTAPEILTERGIPSPEADVFSFGMVMVEAFTGTVPFSDHNSSSAMIAITNEKRPPRPTHSTLTDRLWQLMNRCWDQDRHNRPQMLEVLLALDPLDHEFSDIQQRLENLHPLNEEYRQILHALLSHPDLKPYINRLRTDDLQRFIELLDKALSYIPVTDDLFRKALRRLQSTCGKCEVLPQSYFISGGTLSKQGIPTAAGGSTDVHEAELNGKRVCLRSYVQSKSFYRGVIVWKQLRHPNIAPFLGIPAEVPPFKIVYDWMEYSGIIEYVRKHPKVDRIGLLWGVAEGLHHLHSYNIVHGDLKGANVLIDNNGHARLADFSLASIVLGDQSVVSLPDASLIIAPTWAAPEISKGGSVTKEGDVFSFAMVAAETFAEHSLAVECYDAVSARGSPERPATLRNDLWNLMKGCWNQDPQKRPTTFELIDFFRPPFLRERGTPEIQPLPSAPSDEASVPENPKPSTSEPPRQELSSGDKRTAPMTEREPSAPTHKRAAPSSRWPLKFRSGGS